MKELGEYEATDGNPYFINYYPDDNGAEAIHAHHPSPEDAVTVGRGVFVSIENIYDEKDAWEKVVKAIENKISGG